MEKTEGFYDFGIPYNKDEKIMQSMMEELIELGYKTIAIEETFDHTNKAAIKGPDIFPEPKNIHHLQQKYQNRLRILQRLTIIYSDCAVSHGMNSSLNLRKYSLIAGQPTTDAALTHCCTTFIGDLLCFDAEKGPKLMVNRKAFGIAVKRGMYFEIKYSPAIRDSTIRKDIIRIAHHYCVRGKSKNIIFSSGANNAFELRGPYDVANLSFIFGLSQDQGKNGIDRSCRQLFLRAESRRIGKTVMFVKGSGPIVFSDSSESDDNIDYESQHDGKEGSGDENTSGSDEAETNPQPKKKQKLS